MYTLCVFNIDHRCVVNAAFFKIIVFKPSDKMGRGKRFFEKILINKQSTFFLENLEREHFYCFFVKKTENSEDLFYWYK